VNEEAMAHWGAVAPKKEKLGEWHKIMKIPNTDHKGYTNMCYLVV
jgi:hypothetical protein